MQHIQFVERVGNGPHFRFVLRDRDRGVWDGNDWNSDNEAALLFHTVGEAANFLNVIQTVENLEKPSTDYSVKLNVRVIGAKQPSLEDLRNHLIRTSEFRLAEAPDDGSLVQVEIDWNSLRNESHQ